MLYRPRPETEINHPGQPPITPWPETSRLLRGLYVDAEIYQDEELDQLVDRARRGDRGALFECHELRHEG